MTHPFRLVAICALTIAMAGNALALELTQRQIDVSGALNVKTAQGLVGKLIKLDAADHSPIYLTISATDGTAQGVMILADTIRSIESPVVGVVVTEVRGAGAALVPFTDRAEMYPSAGLVFTELPYEGVQKPKAPELEPDKSEPAKEGEAPTAEKKSTKKKAEPTKQALLLQQARERYLQRFNARLAKRMYMKPEALAAALDSGGIILDADEAVARRVAHAVVDRITFRTLPVEKTELKVTTTHKKVRQLSPESD